MLPYQNNCRRVPLADPSLVQSKVDLGEKVDKLKEKVPKATDKGYGNGQSSIRTPCLVTAR